MDSSILVAGEMLVDFLPGTADRLAAVDQFDRRPGGAPANVAVRLTQLGERPLFWTRVGADPFGDFLVETLAEKDIPDQFIERDAEAKTTLAFVSGDQEAGPRFTFYRDGTADTRFQPGRVPDETLETVDWVVLGGVLLASSPSREAIHDLVDRANQRNCTVVFDPNGRPELWEEAEYERQIRDIFSKVDVVKVSPSDLDGTGFADDPETLGDQIHELGVHTVFQTRGRTGSRASATAGAVWGPATATHEGYDVDTVDTTGAGDAFVAGVVETLASGVTDLTEVLARANAVAAASTTRAGGMTDLPDPASIRDTE